MLENYVNLLSPAKKGANLYFIALILVAGVSLTALAVRTIHNYQQERMALQIEHLVDGLTHQIDSALAAHENTLRALRALFQSKPNTNRMDFHRFVTSLDLETNFRGVSALSWNASVEVGDAHEYIESVRLDNSLHGFDYPEFTIRPAPPADMPAYVVTFIEPMKENIKAYGFDIGSNPERRVAVETARDNNQVVATAPIDLVQGNNRSKGFLLMLPVYDLLSPETIQARRNSFQGVVVAVFKLSELITEASSHQFDSLYISDIESSEDGTQQTAVYEYGVKLDNKKQAVWNRVLDIGGRHWNIDFSMSRETTHHGFSPIEFGLAILGLAATFLTAGLSWVLSNSEKRAVDHAKALTSHLQKSNSELERSNKDLNQFAYIASHDLQTPVRNVITVVDFLEQEIGEHSTETIKEFIHYLRQSSFRMKQLLSDLLVYAQVKQTDLEFTNIDLSEIAERAKNEVEHESECGQVTINIGTLPVVRGHPEQMERVFTNLFTNSLKYADSTRPASIMVGALEDGECWNISIVDNGIGIDSRFHKAIFEPFRRLHRHEDIAGTGLGLGICDQIMATHGGGIYLESSTSEGSTFVLQLPKQQRDSYE